MNPREQARTEIERARGALAVAPVLALAPGWNEIATIASSLPDSARAGFLSHHAFDVACTEALLALPADEFDGLPPPLSEAPACAAFLQFLALSGWHETLEERNRLKHAIEAATYLRDFDDRERFRARLPPLEAKLHSPAVPDGWLTVPGLPRAHCSLRGSTEAFRAVAARHGASSPWVLGFGHPFSLWLAARDAYDTAFERSAEAGKWDVALPSLEAAAKVAVELVPAFERGSARLGKILLCEAVVGGTAIVLYASRSDESLRRVLEAAAGVPAFYVHDSDCGEGAALRRIVRLASRHAPVAGTGTAAGSAAVAGVALPDAGARIAPDLAASIGPDFGAAIEMSDVQRRILRTALELGVTPEPRDCWSRLVLTYLDGLAAETAALPAALLDPSRVAAIAPEALALQQMERRKTGIAPRVLGGASAAIAVET